MTQERCVCGHIDQPHYDEGGEWTYCWECYVEPPIYQLACRNFIPRVSGWEYTR